jgi:hypothetical protein
VKDFGKKLENFLLILFLILIPTQLGKHFWPDWSSVGGIRIDYLAPTLYLVDIIWSLWIATKLITNYELEITNWKKIFSFENLILILMVVLNILVASNRWIAVYRWVRIGQWFVTVKMLRNRHRSLFLQWIIPCWIIGETLLGLGQIISGQNLGGIFYWLGERRFNFNTIGIAQMSVLGEGMLRAYGTFSHPNSLAGFLLVSWLIWSKNKGKSIWHWTVWWMGLIGIIISGSRIVWLLTGIILITNFKLRITNWKKILLVGLMVCGVVWVVSWNYRVSDFVGGWDVNSLEKRMNLNLSAVNMISENMMIGVGAGNFLVRLPQYQWQRQFYWLQPVHNIVLLALVEIGVLGVMILGYKLITNYELRITKRNWLILGVIFLTGMVDHYWLTLPQNSWLLAIIFSCL